MFRPLSKGMIETLMDCHEREILGQPLCDQQTKHIKGLWERKLIDMKKCFNEQGKPYMGFCVTASGKQYLEKICNKLKTAS